MKALLSAGLGVLALGLVAASAEAARAGGLAAAVDRQAVGGVPVENVHWYGRRYCSEYYGDDSCGRRYHRWRDHDGYGYRWWHNYDDRGYRRWRNHDDHGYRRWRDHDDYAHYGYGRRWRD